MSFNTFAEYSLKYSLYAFDFHLPIITISPIGTPRFHLNDAPPTRKECPVSFAPVDAFHAFVKIVMHLDFVKVFRRFPIGYENSASPSQAFVALIRRRTAFTGSRSDVCFRKCMSWISPTAAVFAALILIVTYSPFGSQTRSFTRIWSTEELCFRSSPILAMPQNATKATVYAVKSSIDLFVNASNNVNRCVTRTGSFGDFVGAFKSSFFAVVSISSTRGVAW